MYIIHIKPQKSSSGEQKNSPEGLQILKYFHFSDFTFQIWNVAMICYAV